MIDTVVLESIEIDEETANIIENSSIIRMGIDFEIDEILYRFTNKELKGSHDQSIRIQVKRERWVNRYDMILLKNITVQEECNPYLLIEVSLHKFFLGHNVYGGSDDLIYQVRELIQFIEQQIGVVLPDPLSFIVKRIDYARVYELGDNISYFFEGFSNVYYPRRRVQKYDNTGLYFPGTVTTLKLYDKGVEFKKHDKKRLQKVWNVKDVKKLEEKSKGILRIELEVKTRKLKHIYGEDLPTVKQLNINDIKNIYDIELMRIFKFGEDNMKIVNNNKEVEKILYENCSSAEANSLIGTWHRLCTMGYENVMRSLPKSTFYRHIGKLKKFGISWNHSNIEIKENNIIEFVFNPIQTDLEIKKDLIKIAS